MSKFRLIAVLAILTAFICYGCGRPRPPLEEIRKDLKGLPNYSVILDDMKEEGTFFKDYFHKYRIVTAEKTVSMDWRKVPEDYFRRYLPFLGMTIWVKKDGKEGGSVGPPGYEYVGDKRYGKWNTDSSGRSFWVFYGQYRLFSDLLGGGPLYRRHYNSYDNYRRNNRPYYGPNKEYGTNGSVTKRQKPNFYARRMSAERARKSSFSQRVKQRTGRTRTTFRGRSSYGGGK